MAARTQRMMTRVAARLAAVAALLLLASTGQAQSQRIVSLVPAVTEMLFAIDAGPQVVAVSSYDDFPPQVKALARVGALLDPDVERILALRPDLVVSYGSQTDLQAQLGRAHIGVYSYRHGGVDRVLDSIRDLGRSTGRTREADAVVARITAELDALRARVKGLPRPCTLLVMDRQPGTLREVYASGGIGFLQDMLTAAGGDNVFADSKTESVQPSTETLLARAPQVILEVRAEGLIQQASVQGERNVWATLASVPAVREGRIHFLSGSHLVVPGPRLVQGAEDFARVLHPEAFASTPRPNPR